VRAHAQHLRLAHQRQFVRRLERALVFQVQHHGFGLFGTNPPSALCGSPRIAQRAAGRAAAAGLFRLADDVDVEVLHPPAVRRGRHHVPVVAGWQKISCGRLPGVYTIQLSGVRVSGSQCLNCGLTA
jgi:hypothetical protein